jgi:hypothetical protein
MKNKLFRFISFSLLFAFLFSLLNLATKKPSDRWESFNALPRNSVDVIFLGNSHNFVTFQPEIIDSILPVNSYVIGISAENVFVSYYELKEALMSQHPRVVVLETYALDLDDASKQGYIFEFLDSGFWSLNKTAVAARYLSPNTAYSVFPALRTRLKWGKPALAVNQMVKGIKTKFNPPSDPLRGAAPRDEVMKAVEYVSSQQAAVDTFKSPQPEIAEYLEKMVQLCKENNIELVLVTAPMLSITPDQVDYYAPFDADSFAISHGIRQIKFEGLELNQLDFSDSAHVNIFGSEKISIEIANQLAGIMDLPINEAALQYYQSSLFSGYTLNAINGVYELALIPLHADAPLEYRWKIENADTNHVIMTTEWSAQNSFQFSLAIDANYHIDVEIRNPDGSHTISAYFQIDKKD